MVFVLLLVTMPFGCFLGQGPDPKDQLAAQTASTIIAALENGNYDHAYSYLKPDMEVPWTLEEFRENWDAAIQSLGEFQEVTTFVVRESNIRAPNASTVLMECQFERGTAAIAMEVAEDGRVVQYSGP